MYISSGIVNGILASLYSIFVHCNDAKYDTFFTTSGLVTLVGVSLKFRMSYGYVISYIPTTYDQVRVESNNIFSLFN